MGRFRWDDPRTWSIRGLKKKLTISRSDRKNFQRIIRASIQKELIPLVDEAERSFVGAGRGVEKMRWVMRTLLIRWAEGRLTMERDTEEILELMVEMALEKWKKDFDDGH